MAVDLRRRVRRRDWVHSTGVMLGSPVRQPQSAPAPAARPHHWHTARCILDHRRTPWAREESVAWRCCEPDTDHSQLLARSHQRQKSNLRGICLMRHWLRPNSQPARIRSWNQARSRQTAATGSPSVKGAPGPGRSQQALTLAGMDGWGGDHPASCRKFWRLRARVLVNSDGRLPAF